MPYTKAHKERSRDRILQSAARLFPRLGYDAVSIDMLMEEAGLTRGAFYAHFRNKTEVYAEAIAYTARNNVFVRNEQDGADVRKSINAYLSREHIEQTDFPCPLAFLVTDINTRDDAIRTTYTRVYKNLNRLLGRQVKAEDTDKIMAATAMMIGGVAVARALNDRHTTDKLLAACLDTVSGLLNLSQA